MKNCKYEDTIKDMKVKIDDIHDKVLTHRLIFDFTKYLFGIFLTVGVVFLGNYLTKK